MMALCKELLSHQYDNSADSYATPQEWYDNLTIRQEVKLPDFACDGTDPVEAAVYSAETSKSHSDDRGFTVVAPKIYGSYEEDNLLKVIITTYCSQYKLYDSALYEEGGSVVPAAITFQKEADGSYTLADYVQAKDGSLFRPSIEAFCTLPVSGKPIDGLADKILENYGNDKELNDLMLENLKKYLKANNLSGITCYSNSGDVIFTQ